MKIACVHLLPLEYYPPSRNAIELLAEHSGWLVRAWTSDNDRGAAPWASRNATIHRSWRSSTKASLPRRLMGIAAWHLRTAADLARWRPDAIISVEPHSALAVWLYYRIFRGGAALFIHHHEYYAPEDFDAPGMRTLKATREIERNDLFPRAVWVSETNDERLRLLLDSTPQIPRHAARVLPNYPPQRWIEHAHRTERRPADGRLRLVYIGAVSFRDTFIREAAEWAATRPGVTLDVYSDNIEAAVSGWLHSLAGHGIAVHGAVAYDDLPGLLPRFDVGLVIYRGTTKNFVHNVPNKAVEYLACGLQVWYPPSMQGMRRFHQMHPRELLREMDFDRLPDEAPASSRRQQGGPFPFTAEAALTPLVAELVRLESR